MLSPPLFFLIITVAFLVNVVNVFHVFYSKSPLFISEITVSIYTQCIFYLLLVLLAPIIAKGNCSLL